MSDSLARPILFVLNSGFPDYSGGRENWLFHVATRLAQRGHDVRILSMARYGGQPPHYDLGNAVRLYRIRSWLHTLPGQLATPGPLAVLRILSVVPRFHGFLRRRACRWQPRPIVVGLDTVVAPLAMRGLERELIFVCASKGPHAEVLAEHAPWLASWLRRTEIRAFRDCRELWSNGDDMRAAIQAQGFDSVLIGNGVDTAAARRPRACPPEYGTDRSRFRLAMAGSLLDIKGVPNAVRALGLVSDPAQRRRMDMFFVGKGDPRRYAALAAACGVGAQIHFLGARQDVFPYLQHADLLLGLSGGGGMSMAALESLAAGVPLLAWDTPVYRQLVVAGQTGWLVPAADVHALARGIVRAMALPAAERRRMGERAAESVRAYDWERVVDHVETRLHHMGGQEHPAHAPEGNATT